MKKNIFIFIFITSIFNINTSAEIVLDGSLGTNSILTGPNYDINADLGQQYGSNLFHSFHSFNLNNTESATFFGSDNVNNIISRVTGGNPSNIDGLIRSTIPDANMYFINPNGIMFGPNARLDIQGSFHATTADYLRFNDDRYFYSHLTKDSSLSIAPVKAFGFFDNQIAPIYVQGQGKTTSNWEGIKLKSGKTLSLIGGDIELTRGAFFENDGDKSITKLPDISAPYGRINLASVASQGEINLEDMDVSTFSQLADINITERSLIQTTGEGGGSVFIRSGNFFADNSAIEAKTLGDQDGGTINIHSDNVNFTNGAILNGDTIGIGKGTSIYIQANNFINFFGENIEANEQTAIYTRSGINANSIDDNWGNGGEILLKAKNILFEDGAIIVADNYGKSKGGDVFLTATDSIIFSGESEGKDKNEGGNEYNRTRIYIRPRSKNENAGNGGNLLIEANKVSFKNYAGITIATYGKGNTGNITINSDILEITGVSKKGGHSGIYAVANTKSNGGNAGNISINSKKICLTDGAYITTNSFSSGDAGNITINAEIITIAGTDKRGWRTTISSNSNPKDVEFNGGKGGKGGSIAIEADELIIRDGAGIAASSIAPDGVKSKEGGTINIDVKGKMEISGVNPYGENEDGFGSGIYARSHGEKAGDAGKITLKAGSLIIRDGGVIENNTDNNAKSGNIEIDVRGTTTIIGNAIQLNDPAKSQLDYRKNFSGQLSSSYNKSTSGIYASSTSEKKSSGLSGNIALNTQKLVMDDKGTISTSSVGGGLAGDIDIQVKDGIFLANNAKITTEAKQAGGGRIKIDTDELLYLTADSKITTSVQESTGDGGNIKFNSRFVLLDHDGKISADANEGNGGDIYITTTSVYDSIIRENKSNITASSKKGIDGEIKISSPDTDVSDKFMILPKEFINSDNKLKSPCGSRLAENMSSFKVIISEGAANELDDLLPSGILLSNDLLPTNNSH
ncbi:MAG: filamentous hemagglutinin N-terminal domain-containing protein [Candidatus Marithrix sp.]